MKLINRRFMKFSYSSEYLKLWFSKRSCLMVSIYTVMGSLQVLPKSAMMPDNYVKSNWSYMFDATYNLVIVDDNWVICTLGQVWESNEQSCMRTWTWVTYISFLLSIYLSICLSSIDYSIFFLPSIFCHGFYLSFNGKWLMYWTHSVVDGKCRDCRCWISW